MRRGFTLVEMLVVIGILAILIGAGMTTFSSATRKAQQARAREVVSNVATALEAIYQREGSFPRRVLAAGGSDGEMTPEVAYELAKRNAMTLTYDSSSKKTIAADRCGILTPWGQEVVCRKGNSGVADGTK
ncbi:MAG: type II secretion system protein, partial [Eggerthellaceae bacterium]|nr:type II secretion system protein [Eggerthellaceae bacterium]